MDIAVVVDYVGQKVFVGAKKTPMRKVNVTQLDTRENHEVSVFLGKSEEDDFNFVTGQEVLMDIDAKDYKGKTQYSAGAWKCKPLTEMPEKAEIFQGTPVQTPEAPKSMPVPAPDGVDWDGKELRGHRRACLAISSQILLDGNKTVPEIIATANILVNYVYGKQ